MGKVFVLRVALMMFCGHIALADNPEQAHAYYEDGRRLYNLGMFEEAASHFELAYMENTDSALLFDLGQCHRLLGRNDKALFYYQRYLKERPDAQNRAEVVTIVAKLMQKPTTTPPEKSPAAQDVPALLALEAVPKPPEKRPTHTEKILSWGTMGVGVVLLTVGIALGVQADNAADEANACDPWRVKCAEAIDRRDDLAPWSYALAGIGTTAIVGGGVWTTWLYYGGVRNP